MEEFKKFIESQDFENLDELKKFLEETGEKYLNPPFDEDSWDDDGAKAFDGKLFLSVCVFFKKFFIEIKKQQTNLSLAYASYSPFADGAQCFDWAKDKERNLILMFSFSHENIHYFGESVKHKKKIKGEFQSDDIPHEIYDFVQRYCQTTR